jgi:lipoic acid synthetase
VPQREVAHREAEPAALSPCPHRQDEARPVAGTNEDVLGPRRAVNEVPGTQRPLLLFDQQEALAGEHEEVLLGLLAVVEGVRLTRSQDPEPEAQLGESCVYALERRVPAAELTAVEPLCLVRVENEPTLSGRGDTAFGLLERSLGYHPLYTSRAMQKSLPVAERPRRPEWMKVRAPSANSRYHEVKGLMREGHLVTICEEARCPNIGECWGRGTATFQILGDTCTRACRYCYVHSGKPDEPPDPLEPLRLAQAAHQMGLSHVVVTSVDRDDIPDRGAAHYAATIRALQRKLPGATVEILTPDFLGVEEKALATVLDARPDVFGHNIETVPRLHARMRGAKASYEKALWLLQRVKELATYRVLTKSGIIVGLGETNAEIVDTMRDLRAHGVDVVTIGQYLQPSPKHATIDRWVHPDEFRWFREQGEALGFGSVFSGPLVRSSYRADEQRHAAETGRGAVAY